MTTLFAVCAAIGCTRQMALHATPSTANGSPRAGSDTHVTISSNIGLLPDSISALVKALQTIGGEYTHPQYEPLGWVFSKEHAPAFTRIVAFGDAAIAPLVQCIGDSTSTLTRIQGRPVPLGVLCYEVLNRMIYHEEPSTTGDMDPEWQGNVTPDATALDLRGAQHAWKQVIRDGTFHRNY